MRKTDTREPPARDALTELRLPAVKWSGLPCQTQPLRTAGRQDALAPWPKHEIDERAADALDTPISRSSATARQDLGQLDFEPSSGISRAQSWAIAAGRLVEQWPPLYCCWAAGRGKSHLAGAARLRSCRKRWRCVHPQPQISFRTAIRHRRELSLSKPPCQARPIPYVDPR